MLKPASLRLLLLMLVLMLTACGPEDKTTTGTTNSSKIYNWKMVTTWPPGFPVLQEGAERFAENIRAMSQRPP